MEYIVDNVKQTEELAKTFAKTLRGGERILLNGDLGAGKTTFTKFLAKALGVKEDVTSPTFTILKSYKGKKFQLNHFD
ncbi:MAG: tRNA (adenosine(37)-N6)-threonylcarbamoyltransferase complex ATPase subunit type 1 TsaE, partial [Clostridia bacterium]|nr:tRNA (adenosine(37)-N6)-threonylcarbamoyltransferase complex ATPase subunit type 1 TsaE [Clostridia bacterium]